MRACVCACVRVRACMLEWLPFAWYDRHQHCSLQFFMATCVRLFLEPLADRLDQFVVKFEQVANPSDRVRVTDPLLSVAVC